MPIQAHGSLGGTFGDSTHVPQILFGPSGEILSVASVAIAGAGGTPPTGAVMLWGAAAAPAWAVLCDGASYLRAGPMAALFAVIGTTWGSVDGTHFNVPDMRDKEVMGTSGTKAIASTGGGTTHLHASGTLVNAASNVPGTGLTIPSHTHDLNGTGFARFSMASGTGWVMDRQTITAYTDNLIGTATGQSITGESVSRTSGAALQGTTGSTPSATGVTGNATAAAQVISGSTANATGPIDPYVACPYIIAI